MRNDRRQRYFGGLDDLREPQSTGGFPGRICKQADAAFSGGNGDIPHYDSIFSPKIKEVQEILDRKCKKF